MSSMRTYALAKNRWLCNPYRSTSGVLSTKLAPAFAATILALFVGPIAFAADILVGSRLTDEVIRYDGRTGAFLDTFVSAGSGGLDDPVGVTFGPDGNLYVASIFSNEILRYNGTTGALIGTFVTQGSGGLHWPADPNFGPDGNLYVSSVFTGDVLRFDGDTGAFIDVFIESNSGTNGAMYPIFGPDGNVYVANFATGEVRRYDGETGAFIENFVTANSGGLITPLGLAFGPDGNLYVSSFNGDSVFRYNGTTGDFIDVFISPGTGGMNAPDDLRFARDGFLYITNSLGNNVLRFDASSGAFIDEFVTAGSGGLTNSRGLAIARDPNFAVVIVQPAVQNEPPTADAGSDQPIRAGDTVNLDGSASFDDNTVTANLLYSWFFSSLPAGSTAILTGANTSAPSFVADLDGTYEVQLIVTDDGGLLSVADQVVISSDNLAPTAVAGDDQLVVVGTTVILDGSASSDPEMDPLTYAWTITSAPANSAAQLDDASIATPSFVSDLEGAYEVNLAVSDFIGSGTPDAVQITAASAGNFSEIQIVSGSTVVGSLAPGEVTTGGNQTALSNFLIQTVVAIQEGDLAEAIDKLEKALIRTDGCFLRGSPDGNGPDRDWITDCPAQMEVYEALSAALVALAP